VEKDIIFYLKKDLMIIYQKIFIITLIQIYKQKVVKIFVIIEIEKTLLKHLKIEFLYIVLFIKSIMKPVFHQE
jgi:hypothetical protein